jgi:hypothetical protein
MSNTAVVLCFEICRTERNLLYWVRCGLIRPGTVICSSQSLTLRITASGELSQKRGTYSKRLKNPRYSSRYQYVETEMLYFVHVNGLTPRDKNIEQISY